MSEPGAKALRAHHRRVEGMVADPDLGGMLLLVGIAIARAIDLTSEAPDMPTDMPRYVTGTRGLHQVRRALEDDIRRYKATLALRGRCEAPMVRRDGTCDRVTAHYRQFTDPDTGERVQRWACSRPEHRDWLAERREDARSSVPDPPTPAANTGGVLARHLPEVDWHSLWRTMRPDWTPPPEREPLPPRRLQVLPGSGALLRPSGPGPDLTVITNPHPLIDLTGDH